MAQTTTIPAPNWWTRTNNDSDNLQKRIAALQNINDPTINADDVQRWSKRIALFLLLPFSALLSFFSYQSYFTAAFGPILAAVMSLILAAAIEFGKNWGTNQVLLILMFQPKGYLTKPGQIPEAIMFTGLLLLSLTTFAASIYNSTKGARTVSANLAHENTATTFTPNTADIDALILAEQKARTQAQATKWKGTTTVQSQRAATKSTTNIQKLQEQRAAAIARQRTDWETQQTYTNQKNQTGSINLMAVGGWVELLLLLLVVTRKSSERILDKIGQQRRQEQQATASF